METKNTSLLSNVEKLNAKLNDVTAGLENKNRTEMTNLQEDIQALQSKHSAEIESLKDQWKLDVSQKVTEAKKLFDEERSKLMADLDSKQKESVRELIQKHEGQIIDLKSEAEVAREQRATLQSQVLSLQEQLEKEKERLVSNFRKKLTDFRGENSKAISMKDQGKAEALEQAESEFQ